MHILLQHLVVVSLILLVTCVSSFSKYDFIVVGGGTAGCAITRRLVEIGRYKVLLVEAGGVPKQNYDVPALAPEFDRDPDITFLYPSIPGKQTTLQNDGGIISLSGKMLGGTSSINYMWFNRGHPRDWDNWANITGDDSWKYDNMLEHFKRVESYSGDFPSDQHGDDGPITITRPAYAPGLDYFLEAGRELGYHVGDPNGPQQRSFTPIEYAKKFGRRVSSYEGYLVPETHSPNLQVMTNTNVTQIIFEGSRAIGVRLMSNGTSASNSVAYATKEIILSAGSFHSPLILQRSGIGPRDVLKAANIPILKELPVGRNLQDHPGINLNFAINNRSVVFNEEEDLNADTWEYFNNFGDGAYSTTRGATGQAFISTSVAKAEGDFEWPDVQFGMNHGVIPYGGDPLDPDAMATLKKGEVPISSTVILGRPKSRGVVRVNPKDVLGYPIITTGTLTDPRDLQMFLDGVKETLRIYEETNTYRRLQARYVPITLPQCRKYPVKSHKYWICYIQQDAGGGVHASGTNKMGRRNDPSSVVDSELRVIGIDGLRVVDASIMPFIVNANPHAAVYGIAEKAAYMILKSWKSIPRMKQFSSADGSSKNASAHLLRSSDYY